MKIYNSLSRKVEEFEPIKKDVVGVYTCGPTVYDFVTIGNWRTYTLGDFAVRTLKYLGYKPKYIMNITDVGHLVSDADEGEDKLEKGSKREGKSAGEIAYHYTKDFLLSFQDLNQTMPELFTVASDHIEEQIELVKSIEEKGYAYKIGDGIYFDVGKYEKDGNTYGDLSNIDQVKEGARVTPNTEKKDPRDFALWKFSYESGRDFDPKKDKKSERRQMEWKSPWGLGFPGWHAECSAMSMKYLGNSFDIHLGGEDLRSTHHPNEIAQSEAATGEKPFVKYWIHGAFLQVDGGRMGKSLGNAYNLHDVKEKGFDPLDLRYFYLTGHYRKKLNFTWEALESSKVALGKLRTTLHTIKSQDQRTTLSEEKRQKTEEYSNKFKEAISNDLNMPQALSVMWDMLKSNIPSEDKYDLAITFDEVFGLDLANENHVGDQKVELEDLPDDVKKLIEKRNALRKEKKFDEADEMRGKIEELGYKVKDTEDGQVIEKL